MHRYKTAVLSASCYLLNCLHTGNVLGIVLLVLLLRVLWVYLPIPLRLCTVLLCVQTHTTYYCYCCYVHVTTVLTV
jgi:hypothetical protein